MKISFAALCVALLAGVIPQALYAQGPPPGQPYIQVPIPGFSPQPPSERGYGRERWKHCERLRDREHDIRERLAYAPSYGDERERLEHRLREVHDEREQCQHR
jgi:hypothetical protein